MLRKIFVFVVFVTAAALPQQNSINDTLDLDLKEAVEIALKNNHDLKISGYNRLIADERVSEAWGSAVAPVISANVNYRYAIERGVIIIETPFFSGSFPQGTIHTLNTGVTLEQTIFSGAVFIAVQAAEIFADMSEKIYEVSEAELIVQVKNSYYGLMLAGEVLNLSSMTLELAKDNLKNTKSLYEAGIVSEYDFIKAKVQVQTLEPQLQEAENSYRLAANTLKFVTGLDFAQPIDIKDTLSLKYEELAEFEDYRERMLKQNPVLEQMRLETELYDKRVSQVFSGHLPSLTASLSFTNSAQENNDKSIDRWRFNNSLYLGLNLRVPIFDGWQTSSRVEQAELDLMIKEENLTKTRRALTNQLLEYVLKLNSQKDKIKSYKAGIDQAQLAYDIAQKRFNAGLGTQLEVVDAMVALTRAKVNYYQGIFEYYTAQAQLDKLLGIKVLEN